MKQEKNIDKHDPNDMLSTVFAPRIHQAVERRDKQDKVNEIMSKNFPKKDVNQA